MVFPGVSTSAVRGSTGTAGVPAWAPPVVITTTGSTFSPWVQVAASNVTVTWTWAGGSTTGLTPTINFGSAATRTVTMTATTPGGYNALNQVTLFNIGFNHSDDAGAYSLPASYDWAAQSVSGITGVNSMSGLVLFMAADIATLTGPVSFAGMSRLQHIECFGSFLTAANLAGCTSLIRLCLEINDITSSNSSLDLNPIASNVFDMRAAHQNNGSGGMTFVPLRSPLVNDYHFCIRDQPITNLPNLATQLPVVQQLWMWNTAQSGAFTPASSVLYDVIAYGNSYTTADLTGQFPLPVPVPPPFGSLSRPQLDLHSNSLTSVTLTGCPGLGTIDLSSNQLAQGAVDSILATVDGFATSNGTLNLGGTGNATPSASGLTSKSNLTGRGWTVTTNLPAGTALNHPRRSSGESVMEHAVQITTLGSTFAPAVALRSGSTATVTWAWSGGSTTGLTPSINFGSTATRTVYMTAADASGYDALDDVTVFNIGFDHTQDAGINNIGAGYDKSAENVSGIRGLHYLEGLQIFCAANIANLAGTLDFTGCSSLQHIECFGSSVQDLILSGCESLVRLCMEANNLTTLDLNPVVASLLDCRAAVQQGGKITFVPIDEDRLPVTYHFCVRDQDITGLFDTGEKLPVVQQLWMWDTGQSGTIAPGAAGTLYSVIARSNNYTTADFSGQGGQFITAFDSTGSSVSPDLDLRACRLTSCDLSGCTALDSIQLNDNNFSQGTVDSILATVDGFSTSGTILDLSGNPAPSSTGNTHKSNLQGRGWTVNTGPGSISVVQTASGTSLGGTSFSSGVTAGNAVVLVVGCYTSSGATISSSAPLLGGSSVSGAAALFNAGAGNGLMSPLSGSNGVYVTAWLLPNVPGGGTSLGLTVTNATGITGVIAYEVHGLPASPAVDTRSSGSHATSADVDSGFTSFETSGARFVLGLAQVWNQASAGPGAPWTNTSPFAATWAGWRLCTSSGETFRWRQSASFGPGEPWCAGVVTVG